MSGQQNEAVGVVRGTFTVPAHVVRREFVAETVVLNLKTGQYHGLNPTAAKMLDALSEIGTIEGAAERLAEGYEQPVETIRADLVELCRQLLSRELIEVVAEGP